MKTAVLPNEVRYSQTCVLFDSNNLNRQFARATSPHQPQPPLSGQFWPFPSSNPSFYRPAELRTFQPIDQPQSNNNSPILRTPSPFAASSPSTSSSSSLSSSRVGTTSSQDKKKKRKSKAADWTE